jgi:HD-like signal output (HDOD) protein/ActR/RegA family two-component response regulator
MIHLLLLIDTNADKDALEKSPLIKNFNCITTTPNYSNYIKTVQYLPEFALIEFKKNSNRELYFIQMLKQHREARKIVIIGYGDPLAESLKQGILKIGVSIYFERPLNITSLLDTIYQQYAGKMALQKKRETGKEKQTIQHSDIDKLYSLSISKEQKIKICVSHISNVLAFPFTVSKILTLINNPDTSANDLAKVIETDPVISANILKLSNSAVFAASNRRIRSIKDAIVRIGFTEARRAAMSLSVMKMFSESVGNRGFDRIKFWKHCLSTAIIAGHSAKMFKFNSEEAFLAGLFHDFGVILLDEFFSPLFNRILEETLNEGGRFIEKEFEIIGITHIDITCELFRNWKLPEFIIDPISRHYSILDDPQNFNGQINVMPLCVCIGNVLSKSFAFGAGCDQYVVPFPALLSNKTGLKLEKKQFYQQIERDISLYKEFVSIKDIDDDSNLLKYNDEKVTIAICNISGETVIPAELYLFSQGIDVSVLNVSELTQQTIKPDLILIHTDQTTDESQYVNAVNFASRYYEDKQKLSEGIVMNSHDETPGSKELKPILIFFDKNDEHLLKILPQSISWMYKHYDLRQLDENINLVRNGEFVFPQKRMEIDEKGSVKQNPVSEIQQGITVDEIEKMYKNFKQRGILTPESAAGERFLSAAKKLRGNGNSKDLNWMTRSAELCFQKAVLKHEYIVKDKLFKALEQSLESEQKQRFIQIRDAT